MKGGVSIIVCTSRRMLLKRVRVFVMNGDVLPKAKLAGLTV